ncbi:MAG: heavy metal translocating P-type ATPase metal-binding domain-containing protein, partial [Halobacteriovoraceae bacterium]|nr:heavy metal translocating P-type ATPase metal-binding domain-containing protein [Halobacteriovoraceae bacterium]
MQETESVASINLHCSHCQESVLTPYRNEKGREIFCCQGCQSVYNILSGAKLEQFYEIQKQTGEYTKPVTEQESTGYDYLASQEFLEKYGRLETDGTWSMSFYLKGVHCLACLWLIERLPQLVKEVTEARLNLGKSLVTIKLMKNETSFVETARCLNRLGYPPFPISNQDELEVARKKEERGLILKIGVAAFAMMNIMLYTGSVYAGANGGYMISFGYLSLLLSLPVVFYSAFPFYKSAAAAIRTRQINIDVPLSLAIIAGFVISTYFVLIGSEHFYFDSIATLTFLILLSRLVLKKAQQASLNKNDLISIFQRGSYLKKVGNGWEETLSESLKERDILKVKPLQTIPCDGKLLSSKAKINMSSLTGESLPVQHIKGNNVFMGTTNMNEDIELEVLFTGRETRIGKLLDEIERTDHSKSQYSFLTDKVSKYFFATVLVLAVFTFFGTLLNTGLEKALENALALIIVTCPCALGLATPLTFSRIMELAQSKGIIFKNEQAIERLNEIDSIFFDKTGTLTTGNFQVIDFDFEGSQHSDFNRAINLIYALEAKSHHPIAKSIVQWCTKQSDRLEILPLELYEEILGKGVKGIYLERHYEV